MLATAPISECRAETRTVDGRSLQASLIDTAEPKNLTELDARGQTPPKQVPAVLTALKAIPTGRAQFVRTAGAPIELLRALEPHGVEAYPTELPDGSWRTLLILGSADHA